MTPPSPTWPTGDADGSNARHVGDVSGVPGTQSWDRGRLTRERAEVIAALDRLADESFGRCDVCGVQISDRRLRMAPAVDRCMEHLTTAAPPGPGPQSPGPSARDTQAGETS